MRGPFEYIFRYEQTKVTSTRHPHQKGSRSHASLQTKVNQPWLEVYKECDASSCRQFLDYFDSTRLLPSCAYCYFYGINTGLCFKWTWNVFLSVPLIRRKWVGFPITASRRTRVTSTRHPPQTLRHPHTHTQTVPFTWGISVISHSACASSLCHSRFS